MRIPQFIDPQYGPTSLTAKLLAGLMALLPDAGTFTDLTATGAAVLAGLTNRGNTVLETLITADGVETPIVAGSTQTQAGATVMSALLYAHSVTTVTTTGDGVRIGIAATIGAMQYVANDAANSAQVYGLGTDTINAVATGTGVALAAAAGMSLYCTKAGNWHALIG